MTRIGALFWLGFCLVMGACNRSHTKKVIAVIPKASADLFWQSVHAGAVKGAWENKVGIIWNGPPNETDIAGEMQIVETMINRQVDAIALAPSDRSAFKIVVDRATAAGIPVIIYDSGVDTDKYATFVATDNYAAGELGADRMGKVLKGKGRIVMVKTTPGGASTTARESGFRHELDEKFPGIQILDERFGMASIAQSLAVTENMLTAHPDLSGIFCSNESGTAGAVQALKGGGTSVKLVGFDFSPMLLNEVEAGLIDSLVIQDPFRMGETAVIEAVKAMRGEKTPKTLFLAPRIVDIENLKNPDIQTQVHPDLRKYLGAPGS
ncbi:MAG: substrate-binding domain-containing protein [Acidobacteriaceae bacterium]|nr:substrate-binding domain-containing protein [Acidobacteriaceae bacterium]MBV9780866.1 substrate-binding domain-containing protein [Acidobacteriaceae bacterium]